MQSPEELMDTARTAAWMSPLALPNALGAKAQRGKYIDYLQEQKTLKDRAEALAQETAAPIDKKVKPLDMPDKEYPDLSVREANAYREALQPVTEEQAPPVTEEQAPPVEENIPEPVVKAPVPAAWFPEITGLETTTGVAKRFKAAGLEDRKSTRLNSSH